MWTLSWTSTCDCLQLELIKNCWDGPPSNILQPLTLSTNCLTKTSLWESLAANVHRLHHLFLLSPSFPISFFFVTLHWFPSYYSFSSPKFHARTSPSKIIEKQIGVSRWGHNHDNFSKRNSHAHRPNYQHNKEYKLASIYWPLVGKDIDEREGKKHRTSSVQIIKIHIFT